MKVILTILFIWSLILNSHAQKSDSKNAFYTEVIGTGLIVSVNYERHFYLNDRVFLSPRIGVGWIILGASFPHAITANFGNRHKLELGAGGVYVVGKFFDNFSGYLPQGIVGYRYQKSEGIVFRASITPIYGMKESYDNIKNTYVTESKVFFWGGVSFGVNF